MENVPQILPNTRVFRSTFPYESRLERSAARVVLFDRRQALEVALDARGELVALRPQEPQLRLPLRARPLLARP